MSSSTAASAKSPRTGALEVPRSGGKCAVSGRTIAPGEKYFAAVREIEVRIENGDNAPITVGAVAVERAVRRVDFEFAAGDRLELLADNPAADAPSYDLSMLEGALLAAPAEAATLGAMTTAARPPARVPGWFWGAVIAAGLIVGAALARGMAKKPG